ncbi:MAG: DNA mismatch repair protein MutS [Chlamydiae bacterium]|nr:DNA mismatch repair protein MutS [Chlamydiota bacterium]
MTTLPSKSATPMMVQWQQCKQKAKDSLLLFRMGDFYEAFYDDASLLAKTLELTLTKRQDIPMSGIPHHALKNYLDRLLGAGLKVALAEQTEDPKKTKGLVKREVVRIITPGTLIDSNLLNSKAHNYLACLSQIGSRYGLALLDITTSDFRVLEHDDFKAILEELYRVQPAEIVVNEKFLIAHQASLDEMKRSFHFSISTLPNWQFDSQAALDLLMKHFEVLSLDGFGLKGMSSAIESAGVLLHYLQDTLCLTTDHIQIIKKIEERGHLLLDHITLKHLEIVEAQHQQNKSQTLLAHLNQTKTPMGARLIREWIQRPLLNISQIHARQDAVEDLLNHPYVLLKLKSLLSDVQDLERLIMKVSTNYILAKDLNALKTSLQVIPKLKEQLKELSAPLFKSSLQDLPMHDVVVNLIDSALNENLTGKLGDGQTFKLGYSSELDEWLKFNLSSKEWLANYQVKVREETQIKTLKVGYNRVFGYFLEVSKGQAHLVPSHYHRRQTLANNERFISEELKAYETRIFQAEEKITHLEQKLFEALRQEVVSYRSTIMDLAQIVAQVDVILALALVAQKNHYVKPLIDKSSILKINEGRHPILDKMCSFIPNDTFLDDDLNKLAMITGPNMAGKSTYIRQVALLVILAQMGSYIPAQSAHIGVVDKIFSRIGASDDLARGQSTFMVEMVETANILNNLSDKSLIILDEIGRGTSTYDGIAIAQSTAQYLLKSKAKTLFATHYSELTKLSDKEHGVVNYTVSVHESNSQITFLYKIIKGSTDKSYGIHVAQLAGLPSLLISNAKKILEDLEEQKKIRPKKRGDDINQLSFLIDKAPISPVLEELKLLEVDHLSPLEALLKLSELKKKLT